MIQPKIIKIRGKKLFDLQTLSAFLVGLPIPYALIVEGLEKLLLLDWVWKNLLYTCLLGKVYKLMYVKRMDRSVNAKGKPRSKVSEV